MKLIRKNNKLVLSETRRSHIYTIDLATGEVEVKRRCLKCKKVKPISNFSKQHKSTRPYCKKCDSLAYKEWASKPINKAKRRVSSIAYQKKRVAEGKCPQCGKPRNNYLVFCDSCQEKQRLYDRNYYQKKRKGKSLK